MCLFCVGIIKKDKGFPSCFGQIKAGQQNNQSRNEKSYRTTRVLQESHLSREGTGAHFLVYFTTVEGHGKLCTKRRSEFLVLVKSIDPFNFICTSDSRTLIVLTQPVGFQILI